MSEIFTCEPFRQMHRIRCRMPCLVQPRLSIEADRFDDKGIAFPSADRISTPCRPLDLRQRPSVCKDLAEGRSRFVQLNGHSRELNELDRSGELVSKGDVRRQASRAGFILRIVRLPFVEKLFSLGIEWNSLSAL